MFKVVISKIFISSSFAAAVVISGNSRCVFGPTFSFSFIVCSHQSFLCLFGHSNHLLTMLAEKKKQYAASHTGELKSGKSRQHPGCNTANAAGFHQWATGSITIVLHHSVIDSDL